KTCRAVGLDRYDFAVKDCVLQTEPSNSCRQSTQPFGPVQMVAAGKGNLISLDAANHAIAVEFYFAQPLVTLGSLANQRRQLRFNATRQWPNGPGGHLLQDLFDRRLSNPT